MQRVLGMAIAAALCAACSGGATTTSSHGTGPVIAASDAGVVVAAAPLTVRECDELIEHAVAVTAATRAGSAAATSAETDAAATGLKSEVGARCAALSRTAYTCAMAASTPAAIAACEP